MKNVTIIRRKPNKMKVNYYLIALLLDK